MITLAIVTIVSIALVIFLSSSERPASELLSYSNSVNGSLVEGTLLSDGTLVTRVTSSTDDTSTKKIVLEHKSLDEIKRLAEECQHSREIASFSKLIIKGKEYSAETTAWHMLLEALSTE